MISDVRLRNFRSYKDITFEFEPGVNIVVGPNASGKTNLLEALLVLCRGSSYRAVDQQLVKHGSDWASIDGRVDDQKRIVKLLRFEESYQKEFVIKFQLFKFVFLEYKPGIFKN